MDTDQSIHIINLIEKTEKFEKVPSVIKRVIPLVHNRMTHGSMLDITANGKMDTIRENRYEEYVHETSDKKS